MPDLGKVPATVITGFLGAGKTSLIRHLLSRANGRRLALIVNEFGDVGVDGEILRGCGIETCTDDDIVELSNGCLCCTVADDFVPTIEALLDRPEPPDHIIIETSGLALPKPLIRAFNWPDIRTRVTVDGVVENFTFKARKGSFRDGLQNALNSIDGITADYNGDGRLTLEASDARSLSIADIKKSPLRRLGLTEGTTEASVIGYRQVQTGTEQVKIGEEDIVVASESVKVGTKQALDGYDHRIIGLEQTGSVNELDLGLMPSDTDYLEQLFSSIQTDLDRQSSLISSQEVWSAYDENESELGYFADVPENDRWAATAREDQGLHSPQQVD